MKDLLEILWTSLYTGLLKGNIRFFSERLEEVLNQEEGS